MTMQIKEQPSSVNTLVKGVPDNDPSMENNGTYANTFEA